MRIPDQAMKRSPEGACAFLLYTIGECIVETCYLVTATAALLLKFIM